MSFGGINYLAVILAAIASFAFGALWYNVLARPWMAAAGKNEADIKAQTGKGSSPFIIATLALVLMAWMLAGLIGHLGVRTLENGLITGFLIWLGFIITTMSVNHAFQGNPWSLTVIDGGHWLGVMLVQGAIIGMFGV